MNNLPKSMRLCGDIRIRATQQQGKRFVVWPLRAHVLQANDATQVMIWAPKSLHKHAVDRNRLRRLMREAYRLNCEPLKLLDADGRHFHIAIYNMDKQLSDYPKIEHAMRKLIAKILTTYNESANLG